MTDDSFTQRSVGSGRETARFADYVAIARLDHATKHVFILPGLVLAYMLRGVRTDSPIQSIVFGLAAALLVASANYVINEWLDRDFDRHHPTKSQRPAVQRELRGYLVGAEWLGLLVAGLGSAYAASSTMFWVAPASSRCRDWPTTSRP
jgi:4-hydroxybenzoate polyprenyltransferase